MRFIRSTFAGAASAVSHVGRRKMVALFVQHWKVCGAANALQVSPGEGWRLEDFKRTGKGTGDGKGKVSGKEVFQRWIGVLPESWTMRQCESIAKQSTSYIGSRLSITLKKWIAARRRALHMAPCAAWSSAHVAPPPLRLQTIVFCNSHSEFQSLGIREVLMFFFLCLCQSLRFSASIAVICRNFPFSTYKATQWLCLHLQS